MKVVIFESIWKIIIVSVFSYTIADAYENIWLIDESDRAWLAGQFKPVDVELNLFPFVFCLVLIIIYMVISKKLKPRRLSDVLIKIGEFQVADERERDITNKAGRISYMVAGTGGVVAMILMVFSTSIIYRLPSFPIYLIAMTLIASVIAYAITWCVEFNK